MENQTATLPQNNTDLQSGEMTLGDAIAMPQSVPSDSGEMTLEQALGQSSPKETFINPIPEEHKAGFVQNLGKVFYGGMLKGFSSFYDMVGMALQFSPATMALKSLAPQVEEKLKETYITGPKEKAAQINAETKVENKPLQFINDLVESFGNLGVTLPADIMTGGMTKTTLAGNVLPKVEAFLSKIPDFALGSGWRGFVDGINQSKSPIEAAVRAPSEAISNVAINTLYANAGTGFKGIGTMAALGAANATYDAAKEGRPPSKDELLNGSAQGAAYGVIFSILPHLSEATKIGAEKIALNGYEKELSTHIENGDLPKVQETVDKMMTDTRIRPEIQEAIGKVLNPDEVIPKETPHKESVSVPIRQDIGEGIYQRVVNRFQSLENIANKARILGAEVKPGEDPGLSAERYLSIANQARNTIEQGTFKITKEGAIEKTGEGLKTIIDEYDKSSPEQDIKLRDKDLKDYLIAKRTIEDLQRPKEEGGKENIATPEQVSVAQKTLDDLSKKYNGNTVHLENTAKRFYDYQKRVLHLLVDSGNISQEQYDTIVSKNPNYVPFDRMLPEEVSGGTPTSKKPFSGARSPIKRIKGSELEIHNPIESMIKNTYQIMDRVSRNKVCQDVYALKDIPEIGITSIKPDMKPIKVSDEETIFRPSQFTPKGNVVEGYINGKRKYIEVSKNLYDAMTGLNEVSSNILVKILSKPAQWLRTGATTTPEFILRNPIRDQWTALLQTHLGWKPFIDTGSAIADILKKDDIYNDWIRSGGSYAGFVELSRPNLEKMVKELKGNKSLLSNLNIITKLGDLSQLMEQGTRLGIYKAGVKKGLSPVEAAKQSRESTVDFARRGSSTKDINSMIAFFNAGIQGLDKTIRNAKKDPVGMTIKATASITIPSLLLYLKNRQDQDYKEIPRWQKDLFWMTKIGNTWVRIPKPFLYGQIFGSLPERFMEYLDTKDPKAFNKYGESLYNALSPVSGDPMSGLLPTAIRPLIENLTNYNFFRGRAIVSEGKQRLIPSEQYSKYDTETTKLLGKIFNVSPSKIENVIQGYAGGMGRYALQTSDWGLKAIQVLQGKEFPQSKPMELSDIPLIKGFVSRDMTSGQSESVQQFYDNKDKINKLYNTYTHFVSTKEKEKAIELRKSHPEMKYSLAFNQYAIRFSDIEKQVDRIVASKTIDEKIKREKIKSLELKKVDLAKKANQLLILR